MTRVLVTGANGHVGSNTVRSLLRNGYEAAPFVRATSNLRALEKLGLAYRYGDVLDYPSLLQAAQGCDAIIHHAAVYRIWAKRPEDIVQPAIEGARNLFKAAKENGVRRVVYTSSVAAVGYLSEPDGVRTAEDWNDDARSPYFIAKTQSERVARQLAEEYDIPTVRICPAYVLGPHDYAITPSTKDVMDFVNKKAPTYKTGVNYVHVEDVAEAHVQALEKGEPGNRYIVGGENLHLKEAAELLNQLTGVKPNHLSLTGFGVELLGAFFGVVSKITGSAPAFTREIVQDVVGRYCYVDCSDTNQALELSPRGAEDSLKDTIRWLLFLGKLNPELAARLAPDFPPDPDW